MQQLRKPRFEKRFPMTRGAFQRCSETARRDRAYFPAHFFAVRRHVHGKLARGKGATLTTLEDRMRIRNDRGTVRLILAAVFFTATASAQQYDLLLRGGQVIDPGNGVNARLGVAVVGDHIAAVQPNIPASQARKAVDVSNLYVVPGFVDLHMHVFGLAAAIPADENALRAGTTTICRRRRQRLENLRQVPAVGHRELADASAGTAEHRGQGDGR